MTILSGDAGKVKGLTNSGGQDRPLGDVMREAQRTLVGYLERALRAAGYDDVGAAHASVLATIDAEGVRLAGLVDRGGRTKQATAELAGHLVKRGYLQLDPDPDDRRARLYVPTPEGTTLLIACAAIVTDYEAWLDEILGARGVQQLRGALSAIVKQGRQPVQVHRNAD